VLKRLCELFKLKCSTDVSEVLETSPRGSNALQYRLPLYDIFRRRKSPKELTKGFENFKIINLRQI
jgi:hypothetical protein